MYLNVNTFYVTVNAKYLTNTMCVTEHNILYGWAHLFNCGHNVIHCRYNVFDCEHILCDCERKVFD